MLIQRIIYDCNRFGMPGDFQHIRLLAVGCLEVLGETTRDSNASPDLSDRTAQNSANGDDRVNL